MLAGETLLTGASSTCPDCNTVVAPKAMKSNAGWYVGTECKCGPKTRESDYLPNEEMANNLATLLGLVLKGHLKLDPIANYIRLPGFNQMQEVKVEILDADDPDLMDKILAEHH